MLERQSRILKRISVPFTRIRGTVLCDVMVLIWDVMEHYSDVTMGAMASQITSLTNVYSTIYSDVDQRKHQSSASLASVREIHRWPMNSTYKGPVTRKMFPFDDVIMKHGEYMYNNNYAIYRWLNACALAMELLQSCTKISIFGLPRSCNQINIRREYKTRHMRET